MPERQMRAFAVGQRRETAETAVERRGVSIALACRAFGVSETCYRYSPKLRAENEEIADLLVRLTEARKTWECHELCVSVMAHAGFRFGHALKRSSNIIAK